MAASGTAAGAGGAAARLNAALKRVPVLPLYFLALAPAAWAFWLALSGQAGADPVRALEHALGSYAFKFMLASLAVTPLRDLSGINLLRFRRMLGLTTFWYVLMHFGAWMAFDRNFDWAAIGADLVKRPYIIAGMAGLALLVPLALTSSDRAVAALGAARWRALHRLAYVALGAMVLHYLWLVKSWTAEPLAHAGVAALLLGYRALPKRGGRRGNGASARRPARSS